MLKSSIYQWKRLTIPVDLTQLHLTDILITLMVPVQQNVSVEIGLLKSNKKTWQISNKNLMMYAVQFIVADKFFFQIILSACAFSALTLLVGGRKGIRPVKNWVVGCWHGYLSGARCRVQTCICSSWCHCHSLSLASVKSRLVLPFWYQLTWVVLEKGPLNGCVCIIFSACAFSALGGRKGIRPVKNWTVGCWHGYLSGARCRLAYG